jgi:hypothetical protein
VFVFVAGGIGCHVWLQGSSAGRQQSDRQTAIGSQTTRSLPQQSIA